MILDTLMSKMLPAIETDLHRNVRHLERAGTQMFHEMLTYHMGWTGPGAGPEATGKRIRPLLVLLTCAACSGEWLAALPAASCVELIHNFSLVHDDIQDGSDVRRGRPTVWKKWGIAQAVNAGDVLFILSHIALSEIEKDFPAQVAQQISGVINQACLSLSTGQFLDISFEQQAELTIEDYWTMVSGKTAALLSACTTSGALLGAADEAQQESYRSFGHYLGLAFQVQDDYLGIWGDSALTGKSTESDLVAGKKSLPVLFGLSKNGPFAKRWIEGHINPDEAVSLSELLALEGAKLYTQNNVDQMTDLALQSLRAAEPTGEAGEALYELANKLLVRQA
jgi:geranylgeranyl diphosphate synthase type I